MKHQRPTVTFHYTILIIALVLAAYFVLNLLTLSPGHDWGADFAQYLLHANNLLTGKAYSSGIWMNDNFLIYTPGQAPKMYPPLFPLLVAPILHIFGTDFIVLKSINVFFWAVSSLVFLRLLFRRFPYDVSIAIFVWFLLSPIFFHFKHRVLSDVPFLFTTLLGIYLYDTYLINRFETWSAKRICLLVSVLLVAFLGTMIRTAGIALVFTILFYQICVERSVRTLFIAVVVFGLLFGITSFFGFLAPTGYINWSLANLDRSAFCGHFRQAVYAFQQIEILLVSHEKYPELFGLAIVVLSFVGLLKSSRNERRINKWFIPIFVVTYLGMLIIYPFRQGPRFLFPIAYLFVLLALQGIWILLDLVHIRKEVKAKLILAIFLVGILLAGRSIYLNIGFSNNEILQPNVTEMVEWVKANVALDEHYVFRKPRVLALLTQRTGLATANPNSEKELMSILHQENIRWVVLKTNWNDELIAKLLHNREFSLFWRNSEFYVFRKID